MRLPSGTKRWGAIIVGGLLMSSCGGCNSSKEALTGNASWSLVPITATFDQGCYCTKYSDNIATTADGTDFSVSWGLNLTLIDPAGSTSPGDPGSAAAVDPGCNNAGSGTPKPLATYTYVSSSEAANGGKPISFTWYHPSQGITPPGVSGSFNCDHTKQGPRGHQGIVTLTVSGEGETCTVSFKGTASGDGAAPGQPGNPVCH